MLQYSSYKQFCSEFWLFPLKELLEVKFLWQKKLMLPIHDAQGSSKKHETIKSVSVREW